MVRGSLEDIAQVLERIQRLKSRVHRISGEGSGAPGAKPSGAGKGKRVSKPAATAPSLHLLPVERREMTQQELKNIIQEFRQAATQHPAPVLEPSRIDPKHRQFYSFKVRLARIL